MALDSLRLSTEQRTSLERATAEYETHLDQAASYLVGRGLSHEAAVGSRLGYVVDPMPGHEFAAGWVSIPYLTPSGVVAMKFRRIYDAEGPKMLPPTGQKVRLFNTRDLFRNDSDVLVLCEGEFDTLIVSEMLDIPAIGVPGVAQFKSHWPRCFADFERVVVCFDDDDKEDGTNPGQKGAVKWVEALDDAKVVRPPKGMDVNDWYLAEGRDAVRERLLG